MRRVLAAVLTLSLVACGEDSRLEPDDAVTVTGSASRQDGSALAERRAVLVKEPDVGEVLAGLTAIVGSIGLACLAEEPPELCDSASTATTERSGQFAFSLLGKDTQGSVGQASTFNLAVRAAARPGAVSGASRTERFIIQHAQLQTPELTLWEPQLSVSADSESASVAFGALPPGATASSVTFQVEGAVLWSDSYSSGEPVDARLLEDAVGTVSIGTGSTQRHGETEFEAHYESEALGFVGQAGAPPSRNAPCTATGASGAPVAIAACPMTDGNFVARLQPPADTGCVPNAQGQGCEAARADRVLTVDLGVARAASLLVVRGITDAEVAELSVDGESWTGVSMLGLAGTLSPGTAARYVRLRSKTDNGVLPRGLTELSLW